MKTASQIKMIGGKRYLKKHRRRIILALALSLAWIPLVDYFTTEIAWWVYIAPITIVVVNLLVSYVQSRNAFYKKAKADPSILR